MDVGDIEDHLPRKGLDCALDGVTRVFNALDSW